MNAKHSHTARNYFELFSLDENFDIDVKALKSDYRILQKKYHPDQFIHADESEKIAAVKYSSLLNDGFAVLSKPAKRANYLLELAGVDIQQDRKIDTAILMEQMEFREELESLSSLENAEEKEAALESFYSKIQSRFIESCDKFSQLHKAFKAEEGSLEGLKQALSQILFFDKLIFEIDKALEQLD